MSDRFTTGQAARRLGVSVTRMQQLLAAGRLPFVRTPLGRLIDAEAVEAMRRERETKKGALVSA